MRLQDLEEVLHFKTAIFGHVSAVHAILDTVMTKFSTQSVRTQVLSNFRIVGSAEVTETSNSIILSHFQYKHRAVSQMLNKGQVFGENTLVNIVEFFNHGSRKVEHLHGRDFEASLQNRVNDLTSKTFAKHVRLDNAEGAIVHHGGSFHWAFLWLFTTEEEVSFALVARLRVRAVHSIASSISAVLSTERTRSTLFSILSVGGSADFAPLGNSFGINKLHTNADI